MKYDTAEVLECSTAPLSLASIVELMRNLAKNGNKPKTIVANGLVIFHFSYLVLEAHYKLFGPVGQDPAVLPSAGVTVTRWISPYGPIDIERDEDVGDNELIVLIEGVRPEQNGRLYGFTLKS